MPRMRDGRPWPDLGCQGAPGARRQSGLTEYPSPERGGWRAKRAGWGYSLGEASPPGRSPEARGHPPRSRGGITSAAMPIRLDARAADFPQKFRVFLDTKREASADVEQAVRAIIADVAARGDAALIELTRKFDRVDLGATGLRVTPAEVDAAAGACEKEALDALNLARDRI